MAYPQAHDPDDELDPTALSAEEVARFVTVIEPALLIMMGIVIAAIVLSLYLPLFSLTEVISR